VTAMRLAEEPVQGPALPPQWYAPPRPDPVTRFVQRVWTRSPVWAAPVALFGDAPTCLLKYTTGFVCPGCGGTRAAWYLLHGDIPAAARHHAIFTFAVPFLLYMYVAWAGKRLFNWKLPQLTIGPRTMIAFVAVWGVWSVLRNLPWAPFTAFYV
jgi:hypothetical protein